MELRSLILFCLFFFCFCDNEVKFFCASRCSINIWFLTFCHFHRSWISSLQSQPTFSVTRCGDQTLFGHFCRPLSTLVSLDLCIVGHFLTEIRIKRWAYLVLGIFFTLSNWSHCKATFQTEVKKDSRGQWLWHSGRACAAWSRGLGFESCRVLNYVINNLNLPQILHGVVLLWDLFSLFSLLPSSV